MNIAVKKILICLFILALGDLVHAQEGSFSVKIDRDTLLMYNYLEVTFSMENIQGDFIPPEFLGFVVVGGPNVSSQFSMLNGKVSQRSSYSYFLQPVEVGIASISEAGLNDGKTILRTAPIDVVILPNPEGLTQEKGRYGFNQVLTLRDSSHTKNDSLLLKLKKVKTKKI